MNELTAIDARRKEWIDAVNARDGDRYAALFTEDAVWVPPAMDAVSGRERIREWLGSFFEKYKYSFSISNPVVRVAGDWAVERGVFTSHLAPVAGDEGGSHSGIYHAIWRKEEDGNWYLERYFDVTDLSTESPR